MLLQSNEILGVILIDYDESGNMGLFIPMHLLLSLQMAAEGNEVQRLRSGFDSNVLRGRSNVEAQGAGVRLDQHERERGGSATIITKEICSLHPHRRLTYREVVLHFQSPTSFLLNTVSILSSLLYPMSRHLRGSSAQAFPPDTGLFVHVLHP